MLSALALVAAASAQTSYTFENGNQSFKITGQQTTPEWRRGVRIGSSGIGPNKAQAGRWFMFLKCSGGRANGKSWLTAPTLRTNTMSMRFYYHMVGNNMGTLRVQTAPLPATQNFESGWGGYTSSTTNVPRWQRGTRTPSSGTGPNRAASGRWFMYLECSGGRSRAVSYLNAPGPFTSTNDRGRLQFYYHMTGTSMGSLSVEAKVGSKWTRVWIMSGKKHANQNTKFSSASITLPPKTIGLRFKGQKGTSWSGDMAIDNIRVSGLSTTWKTLWTKKGKQHSSQNSPWSVAVVNFPKNNQIRFEGQKGSSWSGDMSVHTVTFSTKKLAAALPSMVGCTHAQSLQSQVASSASLPSAASIVTISAPTDKAGIHTRSPTNQTLFLPTATYSDARNPTNNHTIDAIHPHNNSARRQLQAGYAWRLYTPTTARRDRLGQNCWDGNLLWAYSDSNCQRQIYTRHSNYYFTSGSASCCPLGNIHTHTHTIWGGRSVNGVGGSRAVWVGLRNVGNIAHARCFKFYQGASGRNLCRPSRYVYLQKYTGGRWVNVITRRWSQSNDGWNTFRINTCRCSGGTPRTGSSCTSNGANQCSRCNSGYRLSGSTCYRNYCRCSGGTPRTGSSCTSNGANQCSRCNSGYRLSGSTCYRCSLNQNFEFSSLCGWSTSGYWMRATSTPTHRTGPNRAASGRWFMYVESSAGRRGSTSLLYSPTTVRPNNQVSFYYHMYGNTMGRLTLEASTNNVHWYSQWTIFGQQQGYHSASWSRATVMLPTNTYRIRFKGNGYRMYRSDMAVDMISFSRVKVCRCNYGSPRTGSSCSSHNSHQCARCNSGYRLSGYQCVRNNICRCSGGTPRTGSSCTSNGANQCSRCNSGYRLSGSTCYRNYCRCSGGTPRTGSSCTSNGANQCSRCNSGYRLSGSTCYINVCSCTSGGSGAKGSSCPSNGYTKCASCNAGRYLTGGKCYSCQPGRYNSRTTTSSSCALCSRGRYNPSYAETSCRYTCGPGRYSSPGSSSCASCAAGRYGNRNGNGYSTCNGACGRGYYSTSGSSSCSRCGAGRYSTGSANSVCSAVSSCPAAQYRGAYSSTSGGHCYTCPAGTFKSSTGSWNTGCRRWDTCTSGEYQARAGTSTSDRVCARHSGVCNSNQWQSRAPTATSDRQCSGAGSCANGRLIAPSARKQANHCGSCNTYYHLSGRQCKANICSCSNGKGNSVCVAHGRGDCQTCNAGYRLAYPSTCPASVKSSTTNYARGRPVQVSSTCFSRNPCNKVYLTDGNYFRTCPGDRYYWHSCSISTYGTQWAKVDLGKVICVRQIKIWSRCDCCQSQMAGAWAEVLVNNRWTRCSSRLSSQSRSFTFSCSLTGTAVRVRKNTGVYLTIAEIQVFGGAKVPRTCDAWAGSCSHGTLISPQSRRTRHNHCGSCNLGYRLLGTSCARNTCTCSNGVPRSPCPVHGANICSSCTTGFRISGSTCVANRCVCSNGSPRTGSSCTSHGTNACASCSSGYYLRGGNCLQYPTCNPGYVVKSDSGTPRCTTCPSSQYKPQRTDHTQWQTQCINKAPCPVGQLRVGTSLSSGGSCSSCPNGRYKTSSGSWTTGCAAVGSCGRGTERTGYSSSSGGSCTKCPTGRYAWQSSNAWSMRCTAVGSCPAAQYRGAYSSTSGGHCYTCPAGTFKSSMGSWNTGCRRWDTCTSGEYQARAGTSTSDRVCARHSGVCNSNQWQSRAPTATSDRQCSGAGSCANGRLIASSARKQANHCGSCNTYYHLSGRQCKANICSCSNGKGNSVCVAHGRGDCQTCNAGYRLAYPSTCPASVKSSTTNYARGRPVQVSSTCFSRNPCNKVYLTDGNYFRTCPGDRYYWHSCSISTYGTQWAKVDLGKVICVRQIKIWSRCDCCQSQMAGAWAEVLVNNRWTRCSSRLSSQSRSFTFSCSLTGTAVRVRKNTGVYLTIAEIQVFGGANVPGKCLLNTCKCGGGVAVSGAACTTNGANKCQRCNPGYYMTSSFSCALNRCTCRYGTATTGSSCPKHNTEHCRLCGIGYGLSVRAIGGQSTLMCTKIKGCPAGQYRTSSSLKYLQQFPWKPGNSLGACVSCPQGTFKSRTGWYATTCAAIQACPAGQYRAGYSRLSGGACSPCAKGTYKSSTGSFASQCAPLGACPAGSYRSGYSSTSAGSCRRCSAGNFKSSLGSWASTCSRIPSCPAGQQRTSWSATSAGYCRACPSGTFKPSVGMYATACIAWDVCSKGEWMSRPGSSTADRLCTRHLGPCNANQYQVKAPTATSDRVCSGAGSCANGKLIELSKRTQANHCGACNSGYRLLGKSCLGWAGSCTNGALTTQLKRTQNNHCGSCNNGYHIVGKSCVGWAGTCSNGALITQSMRTQDNHCQSCNAGYHLVGKTCVAWAGSCANGALIRQSSRTQDNHCGSCNAGYRLLGKSCPPWSGSCANGALTSQSRRTQDNHCGSCNAGYRLVGKSCVAWGGGCRNGALTTQSKRTQDNHCGSCNAGYRLVGKSCVAWGGSCANGALTSQSRRTQDNHCGSCNAGYRLVGKSCVAWGGSCSNGALTTQSKRTQDNHCGSCNAGYRLVGKACLGWAGTCANGVLIPQAKRTKDNHCQSCNSKFFLSGTNCNAWDVCTNGEYEKKKPTATSDRVCATHASACNANEYESKPATATSDRECKGAGSCANGKLITQANRTEANHCGSCNAGYRLVGKSCVAWGGNCANGALLPQKQRTQDNHCASCNAGYRMVGTGIVCLAWSGKCSNGTLIGQNKRTQDNHCGSCNGGHHLVGTLCKAWSGVCTNGVLISPQSKRNVDGHCGACNAGYRLVGFSCVAWAGSCNNGKLAPQSKRNQSNHCGSCHAGYYLTSASCNAWGGSCPNGALAAQTVRTQFNQCGSCDAGYQLTTIKRCQAWGGSCSNGALTTQSKRTQDNHCGSCNAGYRLVGKACLGWAGTCANGVLIPQAKRTKDNHCQSCNSKFFLSGTNCNAWDVCTNGEYEKKKPTATSDRVCATHASACNANEYESKPATATSDRECKGAGSCANGKLITQANRTEANHCGSCNAGYRLVGKSCVAWGGNCANGALLPQKQRTQDNHCASCNAGFTLNNKDCVNNRCKCSNGTPAQGALCTRFGATLCTGCYKGYYKSASKSCSKIMPCPLGKFRSGYSSSSAGLCKACPAGKFKDKVGNYLSICQPLAVCSAGQDLKGSSVAASGACTPCPLGTFKTTTGSYKTRCVAWDVCTNGEYQVRPGSATLDRQCATVRRTCDANEYQVKPPTANSDRICSGAGTCANGKLIALALRTQVNHCGSCAAGYTLANKQCKKNICVCANGIPLKDAACAASGASMCASCNPGFALNATLNKCTAHKSCPPGQYRYGHSAVSTGKCVACAAGGFKSIAGTYNTNCTSWNTCTKGEYEKIAGTVTTDRVCATRGGCDVTTYGTHRCADIVNSPISLGVDVEDLLKLLADFGSKADGKITDIVCDAQNAIDVEDLLALLAQFGTFCNTKG
eukprot:COSAG01_NODE_266_length_19876_cov_13.504525_5_plen_3482_part_00